MIIPLLAAIASGSGTVSAPAPGRVTFELRAYAAAVEFVQGPPGSVTVSTPGSPNARIDLEATGGRFEARVQGRRQVREGTVRVELPPGSAVEATTVTGAIDASGALAEVRARTMSGRVTSKGPREVDVETIDGPVRIEGVDGKVRVHTISGSVLIAGGPALQAEVETSSGPAEVRGLCGKDCRIDIDSVSGEVRLALDARSSFAVRFNSHTGKLRDRGASKASEDVWIDAVWGGGEGRIECETFSADAILTGR